METIHNSLFKKSSEENNDSKDQGNTIKLMRIQDIKFDDSLLDSSSLFYNETDSLNNSECNIKIMNDLKPPNLFASSSFLNESQVSDSEYDYSHGMNDEKFKEIQEQMKRNQERRSIIPDIDLSKIQYEPILSSNSNSIKFELFGKMKELQSEMNK